MGLAPSDLAVIVTGGARGLGRAMALGLAKAGVRVAVADLPSSQTAVRELIDLARAQQLQERIHPIECDVTRWDACSAAERSLFCSFLAWAHWWPFAGGFSAATKRPS